MTSEEAKGNIIHAIRWNDMPKKEALDIAIKALETLEEFEKAQIITGGRLNGRTYAYKCGLEDGKHNALEQEPCEDTISRQAVISTIYDNKSDFKNDFAQGFFADKIRALTPKPKTGHWVYKIYGGFHEQGDWYCSRCDYPFNYGYGHAEFCPKCGCKMSETPTEEVISEYDKRRGV